MLETHQNCKACEDRVLFLLFSLRVHSIDV